MTVLLDAPGERQDHVDVVEEVADLALDVQVVDPEPYGHPHLAGVARVARLTHVRLPVSVQQALDEVGDLSIAEAGRVVDEADVDRVMREVVVLDDDQQIVPVVVMLVEDPRLALVEAQHPDEQSGLGLVRHEVSMGLDALAVDGGVDVDGHVFSSGGALRTPLGRRSPCSREVCKVADISNQASSYIRHLPSVSTSCIFSRTSFFTKKCTICQAWVFIGLEKKRVL